METSNGGPRERTGWTGETDRPHFFLCLPDKHCFRHIPRVEELSEYRPENLRLGASEYGGEVSAGL